MNILVAHNYYKLAGGEDQCVTAEIAMLRAHGHPVTQSCLSNDATDGMGRLELASRTIWIQPAAWEMRRLVAYCGSADWPQLSRSLLRRALKRGDVFHLWGRTCELQDAGRWRRLDDVLQFMHDVAGDALISRIDRLRSVLRRRPDEIPIR
jgi:hypothetical protein